MSEWPYVIAAYAVSWTILLSFAAYLVTRDRRAQREAQRAARGGRR
jgi:CcmD family protein